MHLLAATLLFSLAAEAQQALSAREACDQVYYTYTACRAEVRYSGNDFDFMHGRERAQMKCSDGKKLSFYDRLEAMDIASILMIPYQTGSVPLPEKRRNWDPGRLRAEALFKGVFGHNEASVRANLVPVKFLGQEVKFQKQLGAAAALERVGKELEEESRRDPSLAKFLEPFTSKKVDLKQYGFFWRFVKGTTRLSTHSFGTGIDLLTNVGPQYWLWDEARKNPDKAKQGESAYRNDHFIPAGTPQFHPKAVEIFERNGFIWGGKWNHYDTMHFEYRPELLPQARIDCDRFPGKLAVSLEDSAPIRASFWPKKRVLEADH